MPSTINVSANYPFQGAAASTEGDWCRWQKNYLVDGIINDATYSNSFAVIQSTPAAASVTVSGGRAIAQGVFCELGSGQILTVPPNSTGSTRLDIVALTLDWNQHIAYLQYITGALTQPSLFQQSPPAGNLYQFPLALVAAPNLFATILTANISDARVLASGVSPAIGSFISPIASATTVAVPGLSYQSRPQTLWYQVSGTNPITNIVPVAGTTANIPFGTVLHLSFLSAFITGGLVVGGNISLTTHRFAPLYNNAEIGLRWNGSAWEEIWRTGGNPNGALVRAANVTPLPSGAHTPISFDNATPVIDTEGMWSLGVSQRLTAQTLGWYQVNAEVEITSNPTNTRQIEIVHNISGVVAQSNCQASNTTTTKLNASVVTPMNPGEYLIVQVYQDSGAGLNSVITAGSEPTFSAFKIA